MKRLSVVLLLALTIGKASAGRHLEILPSPVASTQVINATNLRRHSKDEIEVVIAQQVRGSGQLTLNLNGQAVAKLGYADWVRLYLSPGRYRFGIVPSYSFGRGISPEMTADVSLNTRQLYRIFKSAGFTSSGGNAVYEIARVD